MNHLHRAWKDETAVRMAAAERVSDGVQIERRTGSRDWLDTRPACGGPCDGGRKLCPSPGACGITEADPERGEPLTWRQLWLDTPEGLRVSLAIVGGIVVIVLGLHAWLT